MRVLSTAEDTIPEDFKVTIIGQLLEILSIIAKNPANPRFTHYVFESLGLLIKFSSSTKAEVIPKYISLIMPALLQILGEDVQEFVPYTFQILAFLLEELPSSTPLPEQYSGLIKPILSPVVWEFRGNVPGVTRLIIAYVK